MEDWVSLFLGQILIHLQEELVAPMVLHLEVVAATGQEVEQEELDLLHQA